MENWGFSYKTCGFNWVKRNRKADTFFLGLGFWTRSNSEICLLGTKGKPKRVSKAVPQICDARIMEHSRKPDCKFMRGYPTDRTVCKAKNGRVGLPRG